LLVFGTFSRHVSGCCVDGADVIRFRLRCPPEHSGTQLPCLVGSADPQSPSVLVFRCCVGNTHRLAGVTAAEPTSRVHCWEQRMVLALLAASHWSGLIARTRAKRSSNAPLTLWRNRMVCTVRAEAEVDCRSVLDCHSCVRLSVAFVLVKRNLRTHCHTSVRVTTSKKGTLSYGNSNTPSLLATAGPVPWPPAE
jgi:hypothetical protein